jgi:hypothetical protein
MSIEQQEEPVWRYWKARAYKAQNDIPKANHLLLALTRERNYYGLLAEDELGDVLTAMPINYVPTEIEVQQIQNQPAMQRVLELQRIGLRWESRAEWSWATRDYDDKQLLAAAELAVKLVGNGSIEVREKDQDFPSRGALDITAARTDFAFDPKVDIDEGFEIYHAWIKNSEYWKNNL